MRVDPSVEQGVIVLTMTYSREMFMETGAGQRLSREVTEKYREIRDRSKDLTTTSCVVDIQSDVAGSAVVRALFDLWREVTSGREGGQVICINYPQEYYHSLTSLGMTSLPGFRVASTREDALARLRR